MLEHLGAEHQRVDGYPLVDAVEQRREIQVGRQPQRDEAETPNAQAREVLCVGSAGRACTARCGPRDRRRAARAFIASTQVAVERRLVGRQVGDPLAGDVGADELVDLALERRLPAGQHTAVDDRLGGGRDDVGLVAGLEHRRVGGVAQRRADDAGDRAQLGDRARPGPGVDGRTRDRSPRATAARNSATESVITIGNWWRPSRATASATVGDGVVVVHASSRARRGRARSAASTACPSRRSRSGRAGVHRRRGAAPSARSRRPRRSPR